MTWRKYIVYWAAGLAGLCALVGALNIAVDPYGLFGTREISGFNVIKPAATTRTRIVKAVQGERARPATLVLGNSRPEMGLDPESAAWPSDRKPVYNAAIPGASVYMVMRYGQDILSGDRTKLVVWGLDFADFLIPSGSPRDPCRWPPGREDWESRLRVGELMQPTEGWRVQRLKDYAVSVLSTQALIDSMATIVAQSRQGSGTRTRLGFNPASDYGPIIRAEGQHVLFAQKNAEMESRLLGKAWKITGGDCGSSMDFRAVVEFLRLTRQANIPVILFINPYHQDYLETIWTAGLWRHFEDWKRRVLALAVAEGAEVLWDFSLLNDYTTEDPPPPGDKRATLRWFWEPAHYKAELGELMLREMLNVEGGAHAPVGELLTVSSIEEQLDEQRRLAQSLFDDAAPGTAAGAKR